MWKRWRTEHSGGAEHRSQQLHRRQDGEVGSHSAQDFSNPRFLQAQKIKRLYAVQRL